MAPSILGNRRGERSLGGEAEQKHKKKPARTAHQSKAQAALRARSCSHGHLPDLQRMLLLPKIRVGSWGSKERRGLLNPPRGFSPDRHSVVPAVRNIQRLPQFYNEITGYSFQMKLACGHQAKEM